MKSLFGGALCVVDHPPARSVLLRTPVGHPKDHAEPELEVHPLTTHGKMAHILHICTERVTEVLECDLCFEGGVVAS